jgi:PAS domain S-box-containing protein
MFIPAIGNKLGSLLYLAVLIAAWYGGLGPGLLATTLIAVFAVLANLSSAPVLAPWWYVPVVLFTAGGVLITLVMEALHAARRRVEVSQQWLTALLTSIGDAVIATNAQGRVAFMNSMAESLCGWAQGDAAGRPLEDVFVIVNEETRVAAENPVERVLTAGGIVGLANHTLLLARDGTEYPIDDSAAPIRSEHGELSGAVMVFRDITERRKDEKDRERLYQQVRDNDRRKDEFLAMLAHELRNPLAAIGNAITLAKLSEHQEHVEWSLEVIDRQMRHLSRLIDDLLDVSRISRGMIELRRAVVDATPIVESAVETVRPLFEARKHRVELAIDRGNLWVDVDATRLEQIVVNLLNNAAKFSENQGRVALTAARVGEEIVISVRDEGIGIPSERLPEMFELFAQGDRSLARSEGGLGVGLTVVKKLAEMHGGRVRAHSEGSGKGSEFTVNLPAAERPKVAGPVASGPAASSPGRSCRILVVDDNKDMAAGMAALLKLRGHDVAIALNGPDAIQVAEGHRPEFVLLDIGLPGMNGYEVAARLRQEPACRGTVIVAVTGYGQKDDQARSRTAGFDYHLVKPIDHDALMTILSK